MSETSFEHQIAFIAVRISIEAPNNTGTSIGTGFLYQAPLNDDTGRSITLLISNKHVFIDPKGKLSISLNKKDDKGNPKFGNLAPFESINFEDAYYAHPDQDVDLACVNAAIHSVRSCLLPSPHERQKTSPHTQAR